MGKQVFRPTITDAQMLGVVEVLQHYRSVYGLNKEALEILVKFEKDLVSISYGTKAPAYVATGVARKPVISLESLGGTPEDMESNSSNSRKYPDINAITAASAAVSATHNTSATPAPKSHASLSPDDLDAELERLNQQMLSELAATGNPNVVISERRKVPRDTEIDATADAELFKSL